MTVIPGPRYSVYDKDGYYITDIRTSAVTSWTLPARGVVGECSFTMSRYDVKNRERILGYGKYILRRQYNIPDWIGVMYKPRRWPYGATEFKAFQAEKVLAWRRTPILLVTGQAGDLYNQILQMTNNPEQVDNDKPIYPNSIWQAGETMQETLGNDALSHVLRIAQRSLNDFAVRYAFDPFGRLYLYGDWYSQAGYDTGYTFREGYNIEISSNALDESGELFNDYYAVNDANTPKTRLFSHAWNDAHIANYGLYQKNIAYTGIKDQGTLDRNVISTLFKTITGGRVLDISALIEVGDTAQNLDVGNLWGVDYNSAGYDGDGFGMQEAIKVLGFEIDDANPKRARVVAEIQ